jgi:hypothetical protein
MFCGLMELRDQLDERARARRDMTIKLLFSSSVCIHRP